MSKNNNDFLSSLFFLELNKSSCSRRLPSLTKVAFCIKGLVNALTKTLCIVGSSEMPLANNNGDVFVALGRDHTQLQLCSGSNNDVLRFLYSTNGRI